jgi:GT2 family glycosyltransferase
MSLDVVVVDYRTPWDLSAFLASYAAFPPTDAKLWVVLVSPDGGSLEADLALSAQWETVLDFEVIVFEDNVGYSKACNFAATKGTGDVIAFFNADVVLTEGALDECAQALRSTPQWGILGPRQVDAENRFTAGGVFGPPTQPQQRNWLSTDVGQCSDVRPDALTVSGAAYFIKRDLWWSLTGCELYRQVAGEPEGAFLSTPHYYEETWCSYHARAHGALCVFYGPVKIVHKWHQASEPGGWADQQMAVSREAFRYACDRHNGIPHE